MARAFHKLLDGSGKGGGRGGGGGGGGTLPIGRCTHAVLRGEVIPFRILGTIFDDI